MGEICGIGTRLVLTRVIIIGRYNIFVDAAGEVLQRFQETCEVAFQASPAYELLLLKAQMDEAEMEALEKVKGFLREGRGGGR